jgi:hypothetical protein
MNKSRDQNSWRKHTYEALGGCVGGRQTTGCLVGVNDEPIDTVLREGSIQSLTR